MKSLSQLALFKWGHEISGKSSKAGFGCHSSDFITKMGFLLEPQDNLRQKSSIGVVTVGAQRWLKSRSFRWPWTGMSGELRPRHLPEWRACFERSARAGRGCVRRVCVGGGRRFQQRFFCWIRDRLDCFKCQRSTLHLSMFDTWPVISKCRFTPRHAAHAAHDAFVMWRVKPHRLPFC